jgi:4-hydroxy-tetrahydrodipicolinate reductase
MKLALIGYGKMGKTIERLAVAKGHEIIYKTDVPSSRMIMDGIIDQADVAIEFTHPDEAPGNIMACISAGIPVVSGTTGWLKGSWEEVKNHCEVMKGSFFYASNYSIGVNIFFEINARLAELMNTHPEYKVEIEEIHHIHKLDAPSGTGLTLADGIIKNLDRFDDWYLKEYLSPEEIPGKLPIVAKRIGEVPGTHIVRYHSPIDDIEISHIAQGREGFASGAIMAAEWIKGKKGVFGMRDLLKL